MAFIFTDIRGSNGVVANTAVSGDPKVLVRLDSHTVYTNEGVAAKNYYTLPTAEAGLLFGFVVQDAFGIRVKAAAGDTIRMASNVSVAAGYVESTTIGDVLILRAINATEWEATGYIGSWTLELAAGATLIGVETPVLTLTSPRWDDLRFPAVGINPPGAASDPSRNTTTGLLEFSKSAENIIAGVAQMPHAWASATNVEVHIHWFGFTAQGATPNVRWQFDYEVVEIAGSWDGSTYSGTASVTAAVTEDTHLYTELVAAIDMSGITSVSTCIFWKLRRLGAAGVDNYDAVATLAELDFHYQTDTPGGSTQETVK